MSIESQTSIIPDQGLPSENKESGEPELFIFSREDLDEMKRLKQGLITRPLSYLLITSSFALLAKKLNLRRLIANPLVDEQSIQRNDKYWSFATRNLIGMGTMGFVSYSFYRLEINKIALFKKYEQEVGMYMQWRMERELREFINR
jgi:hypothetical protein